MTTPVSPPAVLSSAAVPLAFTTLSPPQQGDALCGLGLAVAGVGPVAAANLPAAVWPIEVGQTDTWAAAVGSDTGWYVILSQDCDIIRSASDEPTILIAPLVRIPQDDWDELDRNAYSSRRWAYPGSKFSGLPEKTGLAVDLAWTTSILKGSVSAPNVAAVRPLTAPSRRTFSEWVANRTGRIPFPDDVNDFVLSPFHDVRTRLQKRSAKNPGAASLEARAVGAVVRWFARVEGTRVTLFGQTTSSALQGVGMLDENHTPKTDDLRKGINRLNSAVTSKMTSVHPRSGYTVDIQLGDLSMVRASDFLSFALLVG